MFFFQLWQSNSQVLFLGVVKVTSNKCIYYQLWSAHWLNSIIAGCTKSFWLRGWEILHKSCWRKYQKMIPMSGRSSRHARKPTVERNLYVKIFLKEDPFSAFEGTSCFIVFLFFFLWLVMWLELKTSRCTSKIHKRFFWSLSFLGKRREFFYILNMLQKDFFSQQKICR